MAAAAACLPRKGMATGACWTGGEDLAVEAWLAPQSVTVPSRLLRRFKADGWAAQADCGVLERRLEGPEGVGGVGDDYSGERLGRRGLWKREQPDLRPTFLLSPGSVTDAQRRTAAATTPDPSEHSSPSPGSRSLPTRCVFHEAAAAYLHIPSRRQRGLACGSGADLVIASSM
ncbi:hypothetical protein K490DRAFT_56579 [Saccharata proteae CBS 121410]|uniref:Uncharacterized protein n=1 Tax=Saccharata proteae CBS 121410 TaxID=1314787 RepID=A0A9P4HU00_9PEZI|nr:hypothetical protein K490DRAFT_56579 [Saccharata proteae CBS 121410]